MVRPNAPTGATRPARIAGQVYVVIKVEVLATKVGPACHKG